MVKKACFFFGTTYLALVACAGCSGQASHVIVPDGDTEVLEQETQTTDGDRQDNDSFLPDGDTTLEEDESPSDGDTVENEALPDGDSDSEVIVTPALYNVVLGRPTATSIALNVLATAGTAAYVDYGTSSGALTGKSATVTSATGEPIVIELSGLKAATRYVYRLFVKAPDAADYSPDNEHSFQTQRAPGGTFRFALQGDSHPERLGKMFSPDLYTLNMKNVAAYQPDFYFALGDDFSIERLIEKNTLTKENVDTAYLRQRDFFGILGNATSVFLVNGNHEQAAGYLLLPTYPTPYADAPVFAGKARTTYFALPATDGFYSADTQEVAGVGLLRDYYAFTWGDALFVTIDPYWHSPVPVDTGVPGVSKEADAWKITMGDEQYAWLKKTLENSSAKYKFVFEHHALGSGRGGAGMAHEYEWGGYDQSGKTYEFTTKRPTWAKPVHRLMNDTHVTIFFFGHDHIYAREKVDGVVYQSVPNPADNTYTAFNQDAYAPASIVFPGAAYDPSYGVTFPNSGFLSVTVAPDKVTVDYIRAVLPGDESLANCQNGEVSYSYTVEVNP